MSAAEPAGAEGGAGLGEHRAEGLLLVPGRHDDEDALPARSTGRRHRAEAIPYASAAAWRRRGPVARAAECKDGRHGATLATCGRPRSLPADLTASIERAGYYPALVADVVESALGEDAVVAHLVHQETTFDQDAVRRHITVLAMTPTRLVIAHADDHNEHEPGLAVATATSETVPLLVGARRHAHPRRRHHPTPTCAGRSAAS